MGASREWVYLLERSAMRPSTYDVCTPKADIEIEFALISVPKANKRKKSVIQHFCGRHLPIVHEETVANGLIVSQSSGKSSCGRTCVYSREESMDHIRRTNVTTVAKKWILLSAVFLLISAGRASCRDRFTLREGFGIRVSIGDSQPGIKFC